MEIQMLLKQIRYLLTVTILATLPALASAQGEVFESEHHDFRLVTVAEGLNNPWSLAFLPNGDMLVTELSGQLRIVRNGSVLADPVSGLPDIRTGGQGGLLDVVLHPDFESNNLVYISYAKPNADDSQGTTAVIRGTYGNGALTNVEEVFEAQAWTGGRGHHGSRIAFDADGYMFITVGDRQVPPQGDLSAHPAQDLSNHHGVVVRLHDDGSVPDDNPFVGQAGALPEIWSYGHRNLQGLAVHPVTNEVWETEHGPQGGDELNLIRPGLNFGWPVIGYGVNYGPGTPIHETVNQQGMERPVTHWLPSMAPSGLVVYNGDQFPEWQGSIFAGGMNQNQELTRILTDGTQLKVKETLLPGQFSIRDVREGPDGFIYLVIRGGNNSPIVRLEPVAAM